MRAVLYDSSNRLPNQFVKGPGGDTLPTLVYTMIKKSMEVPVINALSPLMLAATFVAVVVAQRLTRRA